MNAEQRRRLIQVAAGLAPADLLLRDAQVLNVFSLELEHADVGIVDGHIAYVLPHRADASAETRVAGTVVELGGHILTPAFVDGHVHIESSLLTPAAYAAAVVPHGTCAVVADPHEIANVSGREGIDYMLAASEALPLDVLISLPSSVPASPYEAAGATLNAADLAVYADLPRVVGLAEVMDHPALLAGDPDLLAKLEAARHIDGHAPSFSGRALQAYVAAGPSTDNESVRLDEAQEKCRLGQWVMVREGTAAPNLAALIAMFEPPWDTRSLLVTDDRHAGELLQEGHIDFLIRKAIRLGAEPLRALRMASLHAAQCFGLSRRGAIAPGYRADLVELRDLTRVEVDRVWHAGVLVAQGGELTAAAREQIEAATARVARDAARYHRVFASCHAAPFDASDFGVRLSEEEQVWEAEGRLWLRAIRPLARVLNTEALVRPLQRIPGLIPGVDPAQDIVRLAVIERHHGTGEIGLGYLQGYGLTHGAIASSIAHDAHNLIVAGTSEVNMDLAARTVLRQGGGLAVVADGEVLGQLALPIAGLMADASAAEIDVCLSELKAIARRLGVREGIDPFMTLAFVSLSVIPSLRLVPSGLIAVPEMTPQPLYLRGPEEGT